MRFCGGAFDAIVAMDSEKADDLRAACRLGSELACPALYVLSGGAKAERQSALLSIGCDAVGVRHWRRFSERFAAKHAEQPGTGNKGFDVAAKSLLFQREISRHVLHFASLANPSIRLSISFCPAFVGKVASTSILRLTPTMKCSTCWKSRINSAISIFFASMSPFWLGWLLV
ncbi:hypothetical protein M8494_34710 [Serratia ureilytica]